MGTQGREKALGAEVVRESFKEKGSKQSIINYSHACVILNKDLKRKKILTVFEMRHIND